jgi:hypothetical protein
MKSIKIKYLLGSLAFAVITILSFSNDDKYPIAVGIIFGVLTILSIALLVADRWTHVVTNEKGKVIAKFESEKAAMEFANNQARNVRVLMLHIQ